MSLKIYIDGILIPYRKETLKIKTESNTFTRKFRANYNKYPFLLLKTAETLRALNIDRLQNANKKIVSTCTVVNGNSVYMGKLVILKLFANTIKADLTYESGLLEIVGKSIREFMPVINTYDKYIGPNGGLIPPYSETTNNPEDLLNFDPNLLAALAFENRTEKFPEADVIFPPIFFPEKYAENTDFEPFKSVINDTYNNGAGQVLHTNSYQEVDAQNVTVTNRNMAYPCVFLLSALKYALQSKGYTMTGDFVESGLLQRVFFYSKNHQMTKYDAFDNVNNLAFNGLPFIYDDEFQQNVKRYHYQFPPPGRYEVKVKIQPLGTDISQMPSLLQYGMEIAVRGGNFRVGGSGQAGSFEFRYLEYYGITPEDNYDATTGYIEGSYEFEIPEGTDNTEGLFFCFVPKVENQYASLVEVTLTRKRAAKPLYLFHPQVELGRFVPDWTLGKFIENLMTWMNIDVTIDDIKKEVTFKFNSDLLLDDGHEDLSDLDFYIDGPEMPEVDAFRIKAKNDVDASVKYGRDGGILTTEDDDRTEVIENEFKHVPSTPGKGFMTLDLEERDGVGLGIYVNLFEGVYDVLGGSALYLDGPFGIANKQWKNWIRFRLNSSLVTVTGAMEADRLQRVIKTGKVFLNNQLWIVVSTESEESQTTNKVTLELASINL